MAAGILTAILCAWAGMGYWALVWMQITMAAANAAGVWIASGWIPGWPKRCSGVRPMLAFGGYLTVSSVLSYFSRNLDNILIGRYWGAQSLGIYSKAYSLLLLPIGQVVAPMTSVAVPALSQLQQTPNRYRRYYIQAVKMIAYLTFPLVIVLAILAPEIVTLLLGEQWIDAIPIFRVLAVTAMFQPITSTVGWIYVSHGNTRRMAVWNLIASPTIILSFIIGLPWGALGVAVSYTVGNLLRLIPAFVFAFKGTPLSVRDLLSAIYRPFSISIFCGLGIVIVHSYLVSNVPAPCVIPTSLITGACMTLILVSLSESTKKDLVDMYKILKLVRTSEP